MELQHSEPQTPHISRIGVVVAAVRIRIEPLRAHIRAGADVGDTGVERSAHDFAHAEVGDLNLACGVDEKIPGLNVAVDDLLRMKVRKTVEDLAGDSSNGRFREGDATAGEEGFK
ncbi:hypothetical protein IEQ34_010516 [Dendrobium chrysotoxum]|uniref:Uncharacterized protein n=1 Tax=Dendrobium chrysotoxum TaxID=161865 RepID=A0AAV7GW02_DENCH|nr:hypothetical protein IEQ34_010516 [Dendrobium chrysotoxum]